MMYKVMFCISTFLSFLLWSTITCLAANFTILPGAVPGQKMIVIEGQIEPDDDIIFRRLSDQAERATVVLNSPGGNVSAGISIGAEIAIRRFATLVLDKGGCYSICAVMWVSGIRRYMSPAAQIGVHAAYREYKFSDGSTLSLETGRANAEIGAFLNELGLSIEAVRYFTTAGPEKTLPITPKIAQQLNINIFIQDGFDVTSPADRPTPRRITKQVSYYIAMAAKCDRLLGFDPEFLRKQGEKALTEGHAVFGGKVFGPLLVEHIEYTKSRINDQGFVRWCIETERSLREDGLPTGISGPSYDCTKSATSTEYAICSNQDLWALDRAVTHLFFYFRKNTDVSTSRDILTSQRAWLQRRNACGDSLPCLLERYSSRLFDFGA